MSAGGRVPGLDALRGIGMAAPVLIATALLSVTAGTALAITWWTNRPRHPIAPALQRGE